MAEERAGRKGKRYVGVDLPVEDYLALERMAQEDDSSIGRLVRMGVKMLLRAHTQRDELLRPTDDAERVPGSPLQDHRRGNLADQKLYIGAVQKAGKPPEPEDEKP